MYLAHSSLDFHAVMILFNYLSVSVDWLSYSGRSSQQVFYLSHFKKNYVDDNDDDDDDDTPDYQELSCCRFWIESFASSAMTLSVGARKGFQPGKYCLQTIATWGATT